MFNRVLVGIDEETRGRDAIALARRLATADSELTFAHVCPPSSLAKYAREGSIVTGAETQELLASVVEESGLEAWTRWVEATHVGAGLRSITEEMASDLLVVGATDRSRLTRALLGNPTTESLTHAQCVVAVAPQGFALQDHQIRRIGVAYDGTHQSEGALALAVELAEETGAELSAFAVVAPPREGLAPKRRTLEKAVRALTTARDRIAAHDGVEAHVACGNPVEQLSGYSNTVDILVAGARGAGPAARLMHPSTTAALTDVVHCPLLVLTKGAREHQAALVAADATAVTV